ncbi:MAG: hypothetical protein V3V00_16160 [Saprospiraceae bacterium]
MGVKEVLQLINFKFDTDKVIQIDIIENDTESNRNEKTTRSASIDINLKKAFGLLGLYVGIMNAHLPELVFEFIRSMS